jgi:hypothetical protein
MRQLSISLERMVSQDVYPNVAQFKEESDLLCDYLVRGGASLPVCGGRRRGDFLLFSSLQWSFFVFPPPSRAPQLRCRCRVFLPPARPELEMCFEGLLATWGCWLPFAMCRARFGATSELQMARGLQSRASLCIVGSCRCPHRSCLRALAPLLPWHLLNGVDIPPCARALLPATAFFGRHLDVTAVGAVGAVLFPLDPRNTNRRRLHCVSSLASAP